MNAKLPLQIRRRQYLGILVFGMIILIFQCIRLFYWENNKVIIDENLVWTSTDNTEIPLQIFEFDPNDLDKKQWLALGFTERQVETILKYKNIVGGQFTSKAQLKKCFAISEEKFKQLDSYILLPETKPSKYQPNKGFTKKEIVVIQKFNPDNYTVKDWEKLGFSEKQSQAIFKYKQYLGGSFVSKEKLKECFIISEQNFQKLAPFVLLPEKTPNDFQRKYPSKENKIFVKKIAPFNPNSLDKDGWEALGFSEKQTQIILNYRDKILGGNFKNTDEIKKCFVISEEKFNEIYPYIQLSIIEKEKPKTNHQAETTIKPTDFSKVDLNVISYKQLLEFGFTEKDAAMLLSFRKKLGGFVDKQQVAETYEIDKELANKLIAIVDLESNGVAKYNLVEAPEDWLKTHPYFKFSADKIIFYRITNPDEKKILKFLKLKSEYEQKMRMYMKN